MKMGNENRKNVAQGRFSALRLFRPSPNGDLCISTAEIGLLCGLCALNSENSVSTLIFFLRFSCAARHAEADILRRGRAIRLGIHGTVGAAADYLAFSVARQHPLRHIAAQIVDKFLVVFFLTCKIAD